MTNETILPLLGLRNLLDQTGIETLVGVEPPHLPRLSEADLAAVQRDGLDALQKRGLVQIRTGAVDRDEALRSMSQALTQPQVVVRAVRRFRGDRAQRDVTLWYFAAGETIVELAGVEPGRYRLSMIADDAKLLDALQAFLPLGVSPEDAHYVANMIYADLLDILSLGDAGGELAAIELLRSDGLPIEMSREFWADLRAPDWTGAISLIACSPDKVLDTQGVLALQAGDYGWMARISDAKAEEVRLESVMAGALRAQLAADLKAISAQAGRQ